MSLSKSSFLLMVGCGQENGIEFSFTQSLHMQLMEDKGVWISQDNFGLKADLFPFYSYKPETAFDDAFVLAAVWAKIMIKKDDYFYNFIQNEFNKHPRTRCHKFTKKIYFQAKEFIKDLTPPLKFVAVSLYESDHEFPNITFLKKAKEYGINYEFCKTLVKYNQGSFRDGTKPNKWTCEIRNIQYTDFGTLGLKIDDEICFSPSGQIYKVGSGNGTPGNGGTLIYNPDPEGCGRYSIRAITRRLLNGELPDELDIYQLWTYQGKTFREIFEEKFLFGADH
jgi:hypothetical protein